MASASSSANYLQRGYVPWSGNPAEFHCWASRFRSMMYEAGLSKVMPGTEKAPEAPADSTETAAAVLRKTSLSSRKITVSSIHGCIWRRRTARMDFQVLRLRSSSPSIVRISIYVYRLRCPNACYYPRRLAQLRITPMKSHPVTINSISKMLLQGVLLWEG